MLICDPASLGTAKGGELTNATSEPVHEPWMVDNDPTKRAKVVDVSSGYDDVTQTLITLKGSPISGASTVAAVKDAKWGAMNGTTSLQAIQSVIQPSQQVAVFDDNAVAAQALQNGQIHGPVVDQPTALYMTGAQLTDGQVVGQLPGTDSATEQLGLLLAKDSSLRSA